MFYDVERILLKFTGLFIILHSPFDKLLQKLKQVRSFFRFFFEKFSGGYWNSKKKEMCATELIKKLKDTNF